MSIKLFLCVFGFLTQKQIKIEKNNIQSKKRKQTKIRQNMLDNYKENNQAKSQHMERIDAWTCSNAYACVPFFTHMACAFGVISLED